MAKLIRISENVMVNPETVSAVTIYQPGSTYWKVQVVSGIESYDISKEISREDAVELQESVAALLSVAAAVSGTWDSDKLKKMRGRHRMTQDELAKALNVSLSTIQKWEQGSPIKKKYSAVLDQLIGH